MLATFYALKNTNNLLRKKYILWVWHYFVKNLAEEIRLQVSIGTQDVLLDSYPKQFCMYFEMWLIN